MAYVIQKLLRALTAMSVATDKEGFLASDEIGPIALSAARRSWRRQVHIHFAYYKFLNANPLPWLNKHGGKEVFMPGCSEFPDDHKDWGLETFGYAPLSATDLIKRHILTHPSCHVGATMGNLDQRSMLIVNKECQGSHHVAFADLEKSGLLSQASHAFPVVEAFVAPSAAHDILGGSAQVIAYRKRARSEFEDQSLLELKRLRAHMDHFQRWCW